MSEQLTPEQQKAVEELQARIAVSSLEKPVRPIRIVLDVLSQTQSALEQTQARIANLEHDAKLPRVEEIQLIYKLEQAHAKLRQFELAQSDQVIEVDEDGKVHYPEEITELRAKLEQAQRERDEALNEAADATAEIKVLSTQAELFDDAVARCDELQAKCDRAVQLYEAAKLDAAAELRSRQEYQQEAFNLTTKLERMVKALQNLIKFTTEFCEDMKVSTNYPSLVEARNALKENSNA